MRLNGRGENAKYYINSVVCARKMDGEGFFGRIAGDSFLRKSRDLVDKNKCVKIRAKYLQELKNMLKLPER